MILSNQETTLFQLVGNMKIIVDTDVSKLSHKFYKDIVDLFEKEYLPKINNTQELVLFTTHLENMLSITGMSKINTRETKNVQTRLCSSSL